MNDRVSRLAAPQVAPPHGGSGIDRNVLDSMAEGVLTVGADGRVGVFNPAASRILGLDDAEIRGQPFGATVSNVEGLDEFSDAVLAAIYEGAVGVRSTVKLRSADGAERSLAVTASYLTGREGDRAGIVAVFSDVTEVESLREAERDRNVRLRDAYREIEDKNKELNSALKKVSAVRAVAMVLVVVLFGAAAWYVWDETGAALVDEIAGASGASAGTEQAATVVTVTPQRLATTLSFVGRLAPRKEVRVTSPIAGKVARILFEYGGKVSAGDRLVELDIAETERNYRSARAEYLEARENLRELENWSNSPEMARGRRALARAKLELEVRRSKVDETGLLLQQGIIPASEHQAAQRQLEAQRLSYEAAVQDVETVQAKADADALQIARLKLENARTKMRELEKTLKHAVIHAPVSGIVLQPAEGGGGSQGSDAEPLAPGRSVSEGGYLLTVGDLEGLSVVGEVDEVDVVKLRAGQRVRIGGDAFPDLELEGKIVRTSSQSQSGVGARRVPTFDVTAAVDGLSEAHRGLLRLGMSATVVVVLRDDPAVLLVPLAAVNGKAGKRWVGVRTKPDGTVRRVPVEIGTTTLNGVEIVSGLKAGDEVVVSGG